MFHKKTLLTLAALGLILTVGVVSTSAFSGNWRQDKPNFDPEKHQDMIEIFENADYNAWVEMMSEKPFAEKFAEKITQENFDMMVQMHELKQAGDMEGVRALAEEWGVEKFGKKFGTRKAGFMEDHRFEDKNGDGFCDRADFQN